MDGDLIRYPMLGVWDIDRAFLTKPCPGCGDNQK